MKPLQPGVMVLVLIVGFSGCSSKDKAPETLTILDHGAFGAFDQAKSLFENRTGARVVHIAANDAGDALRQALLSAGNPVADVLYGVDNALVFSPGVREKRVFTPYESPELSRLNRSIVDLDQFRDFETQDLLLTPVDHGYVSVNYDLRLKNETPPEQLPRTLRDLATARWAPQFVTEAPDKSSPGLGFLIASIATFGQTGDYTWQDYWRDLLRNGTKVVDDWTTAYVYHFTAGYGQGGTGFVGDRTIVTSYTTSPAAEVYFGAPTAPSVSLEPRHGVFHQVETMGILRGTEHLDLAREWIDFTLSPEFQNLTMPTMAVYPVIDGVSVPDAYAQHATSPSVLEDRLIPARFTATEIGFSLATWLDEWRQVHRSETG